MPLGENLGNPEQSTSLAFHLQEPQICMLQLPLHIGHDTTSNCMLFVSAAAWKKKFCTGRVKARAGGLSR